jgi:hypothetical protein
MQIALNRRLAFMASQRHSWLVRAHSKRGATTNFDRSPLQLVRSLFQRRTCATVSFE